MSRIYNDWIEGYLHYTENTEPSKLYRTWCAIAAVGAVLRRKCYIEWGSETFYPNMYIVLVGPPAARKGTAIAPARKLIEDVGIKLASDESSRQKLIERLVQSFVLDHDETRATLSHSSLTIISPEFSVFLNEDPKMLPMLCDWYDCRSSFEYSTMKRGEETVVNVWVHMLGATTPTSLQRTLPPEAFGTGLASRTIFVYQANKEKIVIFPGGSQEDRYKLLTDLEQISVLRGPFGYGEDFINLYTEWYMDSEENPPFHEDKLLGYIQRRQTQLFKLCMICCAARTNDMTITAQDFTRAKEILEWTEKFMPQTFVGIGSNPLGGIQARVMSVLLAKKKISAHELMAMFSDDLNRTQMAEILGTLEHMRFCHITQTGHIVCTRKVGKDECGGDDTAITKAGENI